MRTGKLFATGVVAAVIPASGAFAAFDLQITEIWPGNEPGSNLTEDWFELTNFGDTAWEAATHGDLYFDDDSQDPAAADPMSGVATIAPGESVIFVNGDGFAVDDFMAVWGLSSAPQIGTHDGSGLGQGGDGVTVFLDADLGGSVSVGEIVAYAEYPDADANGGQSWDVLLGAFSTVGNASGAVQSALANDASQFAIGSPGTVPEPATLALVGLAGVAALARRRR